METSATKSKAGWPISDWCREISIARATYYTLATRPTSVKIGKRTVITECPRDYLQRIAEAQLEAA